MPLLIGGKSTLKGVPMIWVDQKYGLKSNLTKPFSGNCSLLEVKPVLSRRCVVAYEALNVLNAKTQRALRSPVEPVNTKNTSAATLCYALAGRMQKARALHSPAIRLNNGITPGGDDRDYRLLQVWAGFSDILIYNGHNCNTYNKGYRKHLTRTCNTCFNCLKINSEVTIMKKKLTLTIDEDVYELMGELPRKVSVSEIVTWVLKGIITDIQGMSDEEFRKLMDSDPRGREVHAFLKDKIGPFVDKVESGMESVKRPLKKRK